MSDPQGRLVQSTLATQAYERLRTLILDGRLAPGRRLVVRPLCDQLGLSPTPIRAALSALEREGLLVATAHRGYTVTEISAEDMGEIYELREAIDAIAARRSAADQPAAKRLADDLRKLLAEQAQAVAAGTLSSYSDLDLAFHRAIWKSSGNHRLIDVVESLSGLVRLGSASSSQVPGRLDYALTEHMSIISALESGDTEAAAEAARMHVRNAGEALQAHISELARG